MPALDSVDWEACLLEPVHNPEAERRVRKAIGIVPPVVRYFLDSVWWPDAVVALDLVHTPLLHVSPDLAEMVALVVSQESACRYCFNMTRGILGILGFSEARIRRIEDDLLDSDGSAGDRAALQFASRVARSSPMVTAADAAPLRDAGWSDAAVKELAALAAVNVFYNRASTLPALPYEDAERQFKRPIMRLFGRSCDRSCARGAPRPAGAGGGRARGAVRAVGQLARRPPDRAAPAARDRRVPARLVARAAATTALIFAVVARGIGCALSEREACALLVAEGLPAHDIESALAHLAAPSLTTLDRAAAALARDSIWPQPAALQRHARTVRPLFTRQQFVDLIGTAALANARCRLAVAVDLAESGR